MRAVSVISFVVLVLLLRVEGRRPCGMRGREECKNQGSRRWQECKPKSKGAASTFEFTECQCLKKKCYWRGSSIDSKIKFSKKDLQGYLQGLVIMSMSKKIKQDFAYDQAESTAYLAHTYGAKIRRADGTEQPWRAVNDIDYTPSQDQITYQANVFRRRAFDTITQSSDSVEWVKNFGANYQYLKQGTPNSQHSLYILPFHDPGRGLLVGKAIPPPNGAPGPAPSDDTQAKVNGPPPPKDAPPPLPAVNDGSSSKKEKVDAPPSDSSESSSKKEKVNALESIKEPSPLLKNHALKNDNVAVQPRMPPIPLRPVPKLNSNDGQ